MLRNLILLIGIFLWPTLSQKLNFSPFPRLIVWNVGQGLWGTYISPKNCIHFDGGGEVFPNKQKSLENCRGRPNFHALSHYDWDHISFLYKLRKDFNFCRIGEPLHDKRANRRKLYKKFPACQNDLSWLEEIHFRPPGPHPNDSSRIFWINKKILLPGDSTKKAERIWSQPHLKSTEILILGHHGSRTSTSPHLLKNLSPLRAAVASARRHKYGHPHSRVIADVARHESPLLKTEDWGHLIFELPRVEMDETPYQDP